MGHKRIDETMLYVHVAEAHMRELPPAIAEAGQGIANPDQRVIAMLGARGKNGKRSGPARRNRNDVGRLSRARRGLEPHGVTH
ncbi:MAG: hypothetical protein HS111_08670 [Kofleriaceae bacterium]|nr:hypothetical protein [Kofleriaceae bacterium]